LRDMKTKNAETERKKEELREKETERQRDIKTKRF
jgi:hypothetical protein